MRGHFFIFVRWPPSPKSYFDLNFQIQHMKFIKIYLLFLLLTFSIPSFSFSDFNGCTIFSDTDFRLKFLLNIFSTEKGKVLFADTLLSASIFKKLLTEIAAFLVDLWNRALMCDEQQKLRTALLPLLIILLIHMSTI